MKNNESVELDHGGGGYKSWELLQDIRGVLKSRGKWTNCEDDAAVYDLGKQKLVFTSDAFIVEPIFFPGGDIGKIAMCGTINDLSVMGAKPLGISLSIVMEEGFPKADLMKIIRSINKVSESSGIPVVTGDTKVTQRGKIDKIEITTAGVGLAECVIENNGIKVGDVIITSGDLGEHAITLLASRFNYKTKIVSDSKTLNKEIEEVGKYLNACKDPTRGGLAANIVEMANKSRVKIVVNEKTLPYKKETVAVSELLGIDIFSLASEGRFIAAVSPKNSDKALKILKKFNKEAKIIGVAEKGTGVYLKTELGALRPIEMPKGKLIPRIC
ncbi:MAG: hydrogenase expression/formation protein HypE [Patescibacteria group bacterium]